jgi:hypothetical protein
MTITLAQLRTNARNRADMSNSSFISDSELNSYINSSIAELKDLLISAYDSDYDVQSVTFSATTGTDSYALPNGTNYSAAPAFYKLKGVDIQEGSEWKSLKPFNFNERNRKTKLRYRLVGDNIMFSNLESNYTVKLWYIPVATTLTLDADTLNDLNKFSEFVEISAAIKMLQKEESDITSLMADREKQEQRIIRMAQNRDVGQPESVSDIYAENYDDDFEVGD